MRTLKRRVLLVIAGAALAAAAVPGAAIAATDLNVCTWQIQQVGDAVGTISAAPGAVLGPYNGGLPGGAGPYPISFTTSGGALLLSASTSGGGCS